MTIPEAAKRLGVPAWKARRTAYSMGDRVKLVQIGVYKLVSEDDLPLLAEELRRQGWDTTVPGRDTDIAGKIGDVILAMGDLLDDVKRLDERRDGSPDRAALDAEREKLRARYDELRSLMEVLAQAGLRHNDYVEVRHPRLKKTGPIRGELLGRNGEQFAIRADINATGSGPFIAWRCFGKLDDGSLVVLADMGDVFPVLQEMAPWPADPLDGGPEQDGGIVVVEVLDLPTN